MTSEHVLISIISLLLTIVGFFLLRTMNKLDTTHDLAQKNETKILLLQQREEMTKIHFDEKFDSIQKSISEVKDLIKNK